MAIFTGEKLTEADFTREVSKHPDMDIHKIDDKIYVRYIPNKSCFAVKPEEISSDWSQVEAVLTEKRPPRALSHMTRVIGYYSLTENWNLSKIGELTARRKGDYGVTGVDLPKKAVLPWRPMAEGA